MQKQILDLMDFKPVYDPKKVRVMNTSIFRPELMGLKESIFGFKVDSRLSYNEERNTLFINLQNVSITMPSDIRAIQEGVERVIVDQCHGKKPDVVVNYDGFDCRDELVPEYRKMTVDLEKKYATVRRYCSRTFTRHQLATELKVKPGMYSTSEIITLCKKRGYQIGSEALKNQIAAMDTDYDGFLSADELQSLVSKL